MPVLLSFVFIFLFSSCLGTNRPELPKFVETPEGEVINLPDPDLNDDTLLGVDKDESGIRDDVEIFIYSKYSNKPDYVKWALRSAKVLNMYLKGNIGQERAENLIRLEQAVGTCSMYEIGDNPSVEIDRSLAKVTFNTWERQRFVNKMRETAGFLKLVSPKREQCEAVTKGLE